MNKKIKICVLIAILVPAVLFLHTVFSRKFTSVQALQEYMAGFGLAGPLFLTAFQAFQVVVPVVPGYLGCAAGAVSFGPMTGFWCNYIGISAGSIAAYYLARRYGIDIVLTMFSEKLYEKWSERIRKCRSYDAFLFVATLLPLFPDDFLCYFSGLLKMNSRKFIWIILLGKPWCILAYSVLFGMIR